MMKLKFLNAKTGEDMGITRMVDKPLNENFDLYSGLWFPNHDRPWQLSLQGNVIFDNGNPWIRLQSV